MQQTELVQRVRVYLNERDTIAGQPLYQAVVERLAREGASGATVLRGIAGYGPGASASASDAPGGMPIVIEWIDRADRVARIVPTLDDLLPTALITVDDVRVYRALLRSGGVFGDLSVGQALGRDVLVLPTSATSGDAAATLAKQHAALVVLLDGANQPAAVFALPDLVRTGVLPAPLPLLHALPPDERAALIAAVPAQALMALPRNEPRLISAGAPVATAVSTLAEWGLDALPVIDRNGHLVGVFGVDQALAAVLAALPAAESAVRNIDQPPSVHLLMQRALPTVAATGPASEAARMRTQNEPFLVVLADGKPQALLDPVAVLRALPDAPLRAAWLRALHTPTAAPDADLAAWLAAHTIADLAPVAVPPLAASATRDEAIRTLIEGQHERLPVVDNNGALVGVLGRRALLRALAQESG